MAITRRSLIRSAAAGLSAAACGYAVPGILRHRPAGNLILIIADALRADRIGRKVPINGVLSSLTPTCDRLSAEGLSFDNAFASSSWTPISVAAMLYGASPFDIGYAGGLSVRGQTKSAVRRLAQKGFRTAAVNANWVCDTAAIRDGFETFVSMPKSSKAENHAGIREAYKCAETVNEAVFSLISALERSPSFFLYVHYMDTHEPYYCPGRYLYKLGLRFEEAACPTIVRDKLLSGEKNLTDKMSLQQAIARMEGQYNAATLYWDCRLAALLERLDARGLLDDTLVVVTSDHGEEFADNRETAPNVGHATNLSLQQIHSPLLVWRKGMAAAGRRRPGAPVSLTSVVHSVLDAYAGAKRRRDTFSALQEAAAGDGEPIVSALNWRDFNGFSMIFGGVKVNGFFGEGEDLESVKAFHISRASGPRMLPEVPASVASRMRDVLARRTPFESTGVNEGERERLKALGYLN